MTAEEKEIGDRVYGTVWWPGVLEDFPGIMSASTVMLEMQSRLPAAQGEDAMWQRVEQQLQSIDLCQLQAYWADAVKRGHNVVEQGPEWAAERNRAKVQSSAGM